MNKSNRVLNLFAVLSLISAMTLSVSIVSAEEKKEDEEKSEEVIEATIDQLWEATGLNLNYIKKNLKNSVCNASTEQFSGCIQALRSLALQIPNDPLFVTFPGTYVGYQVVKKFGALQLVRPPSSLVFDAGLQNIFKTLDEEQSKNRFNVAATYAGVGNGIEFPDVYLEIEKRLMNSTNPKPAFWAANATNAYLHDAQTPHDDLMVANVLKGMLSSKVQNFGGLGLEVAKDGDGNILAIDVLPGGGSVAAGLHYNDALWKIADERGVTEFKDLPLAGCIDAMRGPENSKATVYFYRGGKPMEAVIQRKILSIDIVKSRVIESNGKKYLYLKYTKFDSLPTVKDAKGNDTQQPDPLNPAWGCNRIVKAVGENINNVDGMILDLRANPGGDLKTAVCVTSLFLDWNKTVVQVRDMKTGEMKPYDFRLLRKFSRFQKPMTVLINSGSASASEVATGALQEYKRAWMVGTVSYGKGTVQELSTLSFGKGKEPVILKQTIQSFHRPSGISNQLQGIEPDFAIPAAPDGSLTSENREVDLFDNPFQIPGNPTWVNQRTSDIATIQKCVDNIPNNYGERFKKEEGGQFRPDYQRLMAEDVLACEIQYQLNDNYNKKSTTATQQAEGATSSTKTN